GPLDPNRRVPGRVVVGLANHESIDCLLVQNCSLLVLLPCTHRGHPVIMRTTLFAFNWKMILSLLPPSVLPINWYRSRYFLFRRISKSEKKHSTASLNVTRCSKSLSRSKSYSKFDGVNRCQLTTPYSTAVLFRLT